MKCVLLVLAFFGLGCAQGGGSSSSGTTPKSIFSLWTATDLSLTFDITGQTFGTFGVAFVLSSGEQCNTTVNVSGSETSGTYSISGSTYVPSTGGGSDPGCAGFNQSGNYSKSGSDLTFCSTSPTVACKTYR
jgi:hypothetical protein